jgi:acetyl esterase/lipase
MTVSTRTDIVYSPEYGLALDVYHDPEHGNGAALIDIHGGGWFRGDKAKDADWATRLAEAGYLVVVPNYRVVPQGHFPGPLEDMDRVYGWLRDGDYDFDRGRVGAVGSSAGGNMTVELGIKYGIPIVSLSGILDIDDWLAKHQDVVAAPDKTQDFGAASAAIDQTGRNDSFYKWFILNYFGNRTDEVAAGTPVHRVSARTGPMFLANSLGEFVPSSGVLALAAALVANDVPVAAHFLAGARHAKGYLDDVYDHTLTFLNQQLIQV